MGSYFGDDCSPTEGAFQRFRELIPSLWERRSEWDIFIGGVSDPNIHSIIQRSPILFNANGLTAHFILINENSYDKILDGITKKPVFIDNYYKNDPSIRMFCTLPQLAVQKPSASDITANFEDYTQCFIDSDKKLIEFLKKSQE